MINGNNGTSLSGTLRINLYSRLRESGVDVIYGNGIMGVCSTYPHTSSVSIWRGRGKKTKVFGSLAGDVDYNGELSRISGLSHKLGSDEFGDWL